MVEFKPFHFTIRYDHKEYECDLIPNASPLENGIPSEHELFINRTSIGIIYYSSGKLKCDILENERLVEQSLFVSLLQDDHTLSHERTCL